MKTLRSLPLMLVVLHLAGCHGKATVAGCDIQGPEHLIPDQAKRIRLGMSQTELASLLGEPDYSPIDGLYYFSTGGDCPLDDNGRLAPCGVVADFRNDAEGRDPVLKNSLQSCWWGAIGE